MMTIHIEYVQILTKLARARGLVDSIADPIVPLERANHEGVQSVAREASDLVDEAAELLVARLGVKP